VSRSGSRRVWSAFEPLRERTYRRIWSASVLSNFGQLILGVGAAWDSVRSAPSVGVRRLRTRRAIR
jgi:hypothetical protein